VTKQSLLLTVLVLTGAATSRVLLVPEDCATIQGALIHAGDADTISVRRPVVDHPEAYGGSMQLPARKTMIVERGSPSTAFSVRGSRQPVGSASSRYSHIADCGDCNGDGRITVGDATYLVGYTYRSGSAPIGEGDVNLDGTITVADAVYLISYIYRNGPPPCSGGWIGHGQVNQPDSLYDVGGRVAVDSDFNPWIAWMAEPEPGLACKVFVTRWTGSEWAEEQQVTPTDSLDPWGDRVPDIAADDGDNVWVAWHSYGQSDTCHIFYSMGDGMTWSDAQQVDTSQARYNWAPFVDFGGGELWSVWYGARRGYPYDVYCSQWNGSTWESEMQVNLPDSGFHWFADISVDGSGDPHVVWSEYWSGCVYYSTYNGSNWTPQLVVNDTSIEHGYRPSIAVGEDNHVHIVWVGFFLDPIVDVDIFYRTFDGVSWSEEVMVNDDDTLTDYMPRVAAHDDSHIWIAWIDEDSLGDTHIRSRSFNGISWTTEDQLDDDRSNLDDSPSICLDANGYPWVIWTGRSPQGWEIYYNRYTCLSVKK